MVGLGGCAADGPTILGGTVGAAVCSALASQVVDNSSWRTIAVAASGAACAYAGAQLARLLTADDLEIAGQAAQTAAETQEAQSWENSQTGASGTVTPRADPQNASCVINEHEAVDGQGSGASDSVRLCEEQDGTWVVDL